MNWQSQRFVANHEMRKQAADGRRGVAPGSNQPSAAATAFAIFAPARHFLRIAGFFANAAGIFPVSAFGPWCIGLADARNPEHGLLRRPQSLNCHFRFLGNTES